MRLRTVPKKLPALSAALFAVLTLVGALPTAAASLRVAGSLHLGFAVSPADRLVVDPSRHRGYYFTPAPIPTVWLLDLKHLRTLARKEMTLPDGPVAVDVIRHKLFFAGGSTPHGECASSAISALDGASLKLERLPLPCDRALGPVQVDALSVDAPQSLLSVVGHRGSVTVIRELKVRETGVSLSWEIREPGLCDPVGEHLVARMRHGTAIYCTRGSSGRAIWIPTWHGVPVPDGAGRSVVRVTGAGAAGRPAVLDRRSGRVAITPGDGTVVVYDAPDERHVATVGPPLDAATDEIDAARHAFDPASGRLYLVRDGVVHAADLRGDADATLARFEVPTGLPAGDVAVDARLHRVFVPAPHGLIALQDDRPVVDRGSNADRSRAPRRSSNIAANSPPATSPDVSERVAVIPRERGRPAVAEATTVIERITSTEVAALLPRADAVVESDFTTSPSMLSRLRHARVLLRAPPGTP